MSKKGEARIAKQVAKSLKQQARVVRQKAEVNSQVVRSEYVKEAPKEIRTGADPGSVFHMTMRWTIVDADRTGEWTWGVSREWGDKPWEEDLHPKLLEYQKLKWSEIEAQLYGNPGKRHRCHHSMETDDVCPEAQDRLLELEGAYPELLFRFRLGNLPRLWGVRVVDEFRVLWYDPTHQIYPVD